MSLNSKTNRTHRSASGSKRLAPVRLALVTVGLAIPGSLLGAGAADAAAWERYQLDDDVCYDAATMDADRNGYVEVVWFDLDNDCAFDTKLWNSVGADDFAESVTFDMDEDGRWETWLADNDQVAGFDVAYFDDNRDGYFDRWMEMPAVSSSDTTGQGSSVMIIGGPSNAPLVPVEGFVGPVTNPDPMYSLMLLLAAETGTPVYGPSDRDGDGWFDNEDSRPGDPYWH